jgi:hypothetical protein
VCEFLQYSVADQHGAVKSISIRAAWPLGRCVREKSILMSEKRCGGQYELYWRVVVVLDALVHIVYRNRFLR